MTTDTIPAQTPTAGHVRHELAQATASEPLTIVVEQPDGTLRTAQVYRVSHSINRGRRSCVLHVREDGGDV